MYLAVSRLSRLDNGGPCARPRLYHHLKSSGLSVRLSPRWMTERATSPHLTRSQERPPSVNHLRIFLVCLRSIPPPQLPHLPSMSLPPLSLGRLPLFCAPTPLNRSFLHRAQHTYRSTPRPPHPASTISSLEYIPSRSNKRPYQRKIAISGR
jgi:hypothetical protein